MFIKIPIQLPIEALPIFGAVENAGGFLAGGCVRSIFEGKMPRDFDIFCLRPDNDPQFPNFNGTFNDLCIAIERLGFELEFINPMVARYKKNDFVKMDDLESGQDVVLTVEIIQPRADSRIQTMGSHDQVISHFDFTVCRAAILDTKTALVDEDFAADIEAKRLRVRHTVCPLTSVKRIGKYATYGYKIEVAEIVKLFQAWDERTAEEKETLVRLLGLLERQEELTPEENQQLGFLLYVD